MFLPWTSSPLPIGQLAYNSVLVVSFSFGSILLRSCVNYRLHHIVYLVSYLFFTLLPLPRVSTPSKFSIPLFGPQRWAIGHLADDPEMVGNF